jgi:hypothetical protein
MSCHGLLCFLTSFAVSTLWEDMHEASPHLGNANVQSRRQIQCSTTLRDVAMLQPLLTFLPGPRLRGRGGKKTVTSTVTGPESRFSWSSLSWFLRSPCVPSQETNAHQIDHHSSCLFARRLTTYPRLRALHLETTSSSWDGWH